MSKTNIRILFIIGILFILTISSYNIIIVAKQMTDENVYSTQEEGVIFIQIAPGGVSDEAGIQVGDRLVMINGDSIQTAFQAQGYLNRAKSGESLIYTLERNEIIFDVKVNLALAGLRIFHVAFIISGILFILLGLLIAIIKPENKYARLFAFVCLLFAFALLNGQFAGGIANLDHIYILLVLFAIGNMFFLIAGLNHALLYFPEPKFQRINKLRQVYMNYIIAGTCTLTTWYFIIANQNFFGILFLVPILYNIILHIIYRKKRRKEYLEKIRITKYTFIGFTISFILVINLMPIFSYTEYFTFLTLIIPLSFFYTTIKYRVYDIYIRIRLSIVYSIIQIGLVFIFLVAIFLLTKILPSLGLKFPAIFMTASSLEIRDPSLLPLEVQNQIQAGYLLLIGILLAFFLYFIKKQLQRLIDKIFYQQKYDYRKALKDFVQLLSGYLTRETIGKQSVEQICNIMKVKGTSIAIPENGQYRIANSCGTLSTLPKDHFKIPPQLQNNLSLAKQIKQHELSSLSVLNNYTEQVFCGIPIYSGLDKLEAILFTGEKLSESVYNNDDFELLNLLSNHIGSAFERARLYEEMTDKERIKRELEIAREIQIDSLPLYEPNYDGLEICGSLEAANEVGGDYYDYLELSPSKLGVIVGDVVGKGTSAAFYMSKIQGFIKTLHLESTKPQLMLDKLNLLIKQNFNPEFFFTALYGVFDTQEKQLQIFRIGHNGLIYYNAKKKKVEVIEPAGIGFGMSENETFSHQLKSETIAYSEGDIFVFLTDGFIEAMNKQNIPFGEKKLCEIVDQHANSNCSDLLNSLFTNIREYSGNNQHDDATAVVVKIQN